MLSTCWDPNKAQCMFPWRSESEEKSPVMTLKQPQRATGRLDKGTVCGERAKGLSPGVPKPPKGKGIWFHAWAVPHTLDGGFLFHTQLCFHIYCCKCFRATRGWKVQFLTRLGTRLLGDRGGQLPWGVSPFSQHSSCLTIMGNKRTQSPIMLP